MIPRVRVLAIQRDLGLIPSTYIGMGIEHEILTTALSIIIILNVFMAFKSLRTSGDGFSCTSASHSDGLTFASWLFCWDELSDMILLLASIVILRS